MLPYIQGAYRKRAHKQVMGKYRARCRSDRHNHAKCIYEGLLQSKACMKGKPELLKDNSN